MFKHAAYAAVAAAAFTAVPASAAITINQIGGSNLNSAFFATGLGERTATFVFTVGSNNATPGTFTVKYTFDNTFFDPASGGNQASFITSDADMITFTGATIDGISDSPDSPGNPDIENGSMSAQVGTWLYPIEIGPHYITVSGNFNPAGNRMATVTGSLTLNAVVPEPATWALFILGFGAIGSAMRRRSNQVRLSKASLNFA